MGKAKQDIGFISAVPEADNHGEPPTRQKSASSSDGVADKVKRNAGRPKAQAKSPADDGQYLASTKTCGRYSNVGSCAHMLKNLVRLSSGAVHSIDWQLGLRGSDHHKSCKADSAPAGWRRHFARPAQSFDGLRERKEDPHLQELYRSSQGTPVDRRPDRNKAAIGIASIREVPDSFDREPGCEGAQVGQWEFMIKEKSRQRSSIMHQTTLRDPAIPEAKRKAKENSVVPLGDNRSDVCIMEMMGKKKWYSSRSSNPRAAPPPDGDARMHHLSILRVQPEPDDQITRLRLTSTTPRCSSRGSGRSARNTPSPVVKAKPTGSVSQASEAPDE